MNYIVYNKTTGEIVKSMFSSDVYTSEQDNEAHIEHELVDDSKFYIVDGKVVERPIFSEYIVGTNVYNLPIPTRVVTNGSMYNIDDGSAELSFSLPGTYKVYLYSFPYQDKEVEVTQ